MILAHQCFAMLVELAAGGDGPQSVLDPAADQAEAIAALAHFLFWLCGVMYVLVLAGVAFALVHARRRARTSGDFEARAERSVTGLLTAWIVLIAIGLVAITGASYVTDRGLRRVSAEPVKVRVRGWQWWWEVEYLDPKAHQDFVTANELHLPVGRDVVVELEAGDVIHSLWIPNLNGKEDLVPGRTNRIELTPRRTGSFRGQCAEFCGLQHAHMALDVTVEEPAAFESWRAAQRAAAFTPTEGAAARGAAVFQQRPCAMCHSVRGTDAGGRTGPDLTHVASRRTIAAGTLPLTHGHLAGWIADPQSLKPGSNMPPVDLEPDELDALVAYLMELK